MSALAVLRLIGGPSEGVWLDREDVEAASKAVRRARELGYLRYDVQPLVPTGSIEWASDDGPWAEVWVPEAALERWQQEADQ